MNEENFGPVSNPDGSPSEITKAMLEGTGRDPVEFARQAYRRRYPEVIAAEIILRRNGMGHTIPAEGLSANNAAAIIANEAVTR